MPFQVHQTGSGRFFYEFRVQILVAGYKRNIHQRAVLRYDGPFKELALIQKIIKKLCVLLIFLFHFFQAAHGLQPFEYLAAYIDAVSVRSIVQAACVRMGLVGQHGRRSRKGVLCDQILPDDHDDHTCRSDIFLYTAVYDSVFRDIHRLRQETGRHIRHQRFALGIRQGLKFGSIDRIIFTNVYIICIGTDRQIGAVRDIGKGLILRGSDLICFSVFLCFLIGFLCPLSGHDVVRDLVFHQIHGNHRELLGRASLKE